MARRAEEAQLADELAAQKRLDREFGRWQGRLDELEVQREQAEMARRFFGQRNAWNAWVGAVAGRRQARWGEGRRRREMRGVLREWVERTRQAKAEQVLVDDFRAAVVGRVVVRTVERWTAVIVDRREREQDAQASHRKKLQASAFGRWGETLIKRGEDYDLADSFKDVKAEGKLVQSIIPLSNPRLIRHLWGAAELQRRTLKLWLRSARAAVALKCRADDFVADWEFAVQQRCWDALQERALAGREAEVADWRAGRLVFEAWGAWKANTRVSELVEGGGQRAECHVLASCWLTATVPPTRRRSRRFGSQTSTSPGACSASGVHSSSTLACGKML